LENNSRGKPFLVGESVIRFNVTHSEGLALIAFTTVGEVGIDVEAVDRAVDAMELASRYFTAGEVAMIAEGGNPQEQANIFLRLWTRKEAVLKAAGYGIARGLDTFDALNHPAGEVRLSTPQDENAETCWRVRDLQPINGFVGAVAAAPGDWLIQQRQIRYEDALDRVTGRLPGKI
jgi:4'-phosphopantetheinyl transferase